MILTEKMVEESFIHENWYKFQTDEWYKMITDGWVFSQPPYVPFTIGMNMQKGYYFATFRVSSKFTIKEIHSRMLGFCKSNHNMKVVLMRDEYSIVESPWQFVCNWYEVNEIQRCIGERLKTTKDIPTNVYSPEFAEWLTEQCRLAMLKGADLAVEEMQKRPCVHEVAKKWSEETTADFE